MIPDDPASPGRIMTTEKHSMHQDGVKLRQRYTLLPARLQRIFFLVGFIKPGVEATKKLCHTQVHLPVPVMNCGIDQTGTAIDTADEIPAPEISMQECRGLRREKLRQPETEFLQIAQVPGGKAPQANQCFCQR